MIAVQKKRFTSIDFIATIITAFAAIVVGGHAVGTTLKNYTLGATGNTIAGAVFVSRLHRTALIYLKGKWMEAAYS